MVQLTTCTSFQPSSSFVVIFHLPSKNFWTMVLPYLTQSSLLTHTMRGKRVKSLGIRDSCSIVAVVMCFPLWILMSSLQLGLQCGNS
jgi:hypothetical protein